MKYDVALKSLLQSSGLTILERLAGVRLVRWLNVEIPQLKMPRLRISETRKAEFEEGWKVSALSFIAKQIVHSFGPIPEWAENQLRTFSNGQLVDLAMRLMGASSLERLFSQ